MLINHGMRVDDFFSQDLELFLRAMEAAKEGERLFIDQIE